jgi:hypothetical protein
MSGRCSGRLIGDLWTSTFDANALPKRDAVLEFGSGRLRLGIIPGGVVVLHAVDRDVVVMGSAFPGANRGVIAGLQDFFFHRFGWEILVALDHDRGVALRDDFSAPGCFGHILRLRRQWIAFLQHIAGLLDLSKALDAAEA